MLEHMRLMEEADLSIEAVQFDEDPEPDYVGRGPEELPY
jgi:hypothetical protein